MEGYLLTFYTQQNREHEGGSLAEWIVAEAKRLGVRGATLSGATEGFGHDGRFHSDGFFDLEDKPVQIALAVSVEECGRLLTSVEKQGLRVFFTKARIEFGFTGDA